MADITPLRGLPFPEITQPGPPDVAGDMETLARAVDAQLGGPLGIPPLLTAVDMVPLLPIPGVIVGEFRFSHSGVAFTDLEQAAVLCHLPRRIVGATRIRWKYRHGAAAITGNFALTIYNAAGLKVVGTGSTAFSGSANTNVVRSDTIAATSFEAGMYYVHFGIDTSAGDAVAAGVLIENDAGSLSGGVSPAYPNVAVTINSGGVTAPANLLAMTDIGASAASTRSGVPLVALSVG